MNPLRAKFAATLALAMLSVVALSTLATALVARQVGRADAERVAAAQVGVALGALAALPAGDAGRLPLGDAPVPGPPDGPATDALASAMAAQGDRRAVSVARRPPPLGPVASVEVAPGRWLHVPLPHPGHPPGGWPELAGWLALLLAGTCAVSVATARRLTRPLALLEAVAAGVGPGGVVARVPEEGPAELRAAARSLNRLGDALRTGMEARMRLVAAAGHDMRTPITRMRLRAEFLDEGERGRWLADLAELERIADSAIDLVREDAGAGPAEAVDLAEVAREVVADLAAMGLPVRVGETPRALAAVPRLAMTRAARNLAANAATHGGGATLSTAAGDGFATLLVTDAGPGIPEHLVPRVFEPFFRVDPARRQAVKGAGLGLAIAHGIVARAGGTLALSNIQGGGLRQEARLPQAAG